jgi:hypothetical protein
MCQKAVAGPFSVLAEVLHQDFAWTRGAPSMFQSSSRSVRDFCAACGTPLSYREIGGPLIELLTGAFDKPGRLTPTYEVGAEGRLAWLDHLASLPRKTTLETVGSEELSSMESYQHPDHDTGVDWTPRRTGHLR